MEAARLRFAFRLARMDAAKRLFKDKFGRVGVLEEPERMGSKALDLRAKALCASNEAPPVPVQASPDGGGGNN